MDVRTKIICTMGPSVNNAAMVEQLIDAGMNVARINFSHGTHESHKKTIDLLKEARQKKKVSLGIMLDTKGPEIRIGTLLSGQREVLPGLRIKLSSAPEDDSQIQITPANVIEFVEIGTRILIDDGYLICHVVAKDAKSIDVEFVNGGMLKSNKGVNIPGVRVELPAMTEQDVADITFGCQMDVDIIAASFIRSAEHVLEIKKLLIALGKPDIIVIAKIESHEGVNNFDSIVQVADGIMVARGDLGVELPLEEVPSLQKMMIRRCALSAKPVVTATQMLESMIRNPRPTRAEVSDVANAIYDSTSAVMLSGETAVGYYPVEAVKIMKRIICEAEKNFSFRQFFTKDGSVDSSDVASAVTLASVKTAYSSGAKAIFAFTNSGLTARLLSRARPEMPIVALTPHAKSYHQMSLFWGVVPVDPTPCENITEAFNAVASFAKQRAIVAYGDIVVITAGYPFGVSGSTNTMMVESIGSVIVRGRPGSGSSVHGQVAVILMPNAQSADAVRDRIVVLSRCCDSDVALLRGALGVVLQNRGDDTQSEQAAENIGKSLGIPVIVRAQGAMTRLKDGQLVTLDPARGLVYKGSLFDSTEGKY
jgi:pyruvate kinase